LSENKNHKWTKEEEIILTDNYLKGVDYCSKLLNIGNSKIKGKIKRLKKKGLI